MWSQARAIVWAQWRTLRNYLPRTSKAMFVFAALLSTIWYGGFAFLAAVAAIAMADPDEIEFVRSVFPAALLICFLYWQFIPVLMVSMGSSLDIRKLLVYPIPHRQLFTLEVLLRVSIGIEMLLVVTGAGIGLLLNPNIPVWAPFFLLFFVALNLLISAGVRDLLVRLLGRKRVREITGILMVLIAALPQLLVFAGFQSRIKQFFAGEPGAFWPWTATARLAQGQFSLASAGALLAWTLAAYVFGRWQFERGLRFDFTDTAVKTEPSGRKASRLEWLYQLPNALLPDPLGGLVEKELRFLSRSARFRLVFLMGFSFGLLIWIPVAFESPRGSHSLLADNYLAVVSVYSLILLSSVFLNCFGLDRSAAQVYFLTPLKLKTVLLGKNLTAGFFVLLEISAVALVCMLLRLPITGMQVLEAVSVTLVVTLFLFAVGNVTSVYSPFPVNPVKSFRTGAGNRSQGLLMLAFPVLLAPAALAYVARYAFGSEWAFFGVLLIGLLLGAVIYAYSMESAVEAAEARKERIITALGRGEGPIES